MGILLHIVVNPGFLAPVLRHIENKEGKGVMVLNPGVITQYMALLLPKFFILKWAEI